MPSHLGKNRKALKEKEAEQDAVFLTTGEGHEPDKKPGTTVDEHSNDGAKVGSVGNAKKAGGKQRGKKADVGGFVKPDNEKDKRDREQRTEETEKSQRRLDDLNHWAESLLSCLDPEAKKNFHIAAFDAKVLDIGLYVLGILNRMHKMADYFEPDIEKEWELGMIGYDQDLYCQYCQKKIEEPQHLKQLYCNNRCARNARLKNQTGLVFPKEVAADTIDPEEKQWEIEQKRTGARA